MRVLFQLWLLALVFHTAIPCMAEQASSLAVPEEHIRRK